MDKLPSILIVDDNDSLLCALRESCIIEGFRCGTAACAEDALDMLGKEEYDVLLTDIVLPGMKGLELARNAKQLRQGLIVIVMTGFLAEFSYDDVMQAGASDFIKKPFTVQEMLMRIRHARMQDQLRELSFTDELTGLPNRRGFFAFAQQELRVVLRTQGKMTLLFADLDDFKAINDTWGHEAGDEALGHATRILQETFRDSDIIARMGGDEFAALLLDTDEERVAPALDRLQKRIGEFNASGAAPYRLSVSVGTALCDAKHQCSIDELMRRADERMYEAKQRKKSERDRA